MNSRKCYNNGRNIESNVLPVDRTTLNGTSVNIPYNDWQLYLANEGLTQPIFLIHSHHLIIINMETRTEVLYNSLTETKWWK